MIILPAIDMIDKKIVRLSEGDFEKKTFYKRTVVEQAHFFEDAGFTHLHMINLTGTLDPTAQVYDIIQEIKEKTKLTLQFGGGIRSKSDIQNLIDLNVDRIILSTILFEQFISIESIIKSNLNTTFVAALDSRNDDIFIHGWKTNTGIKLDTFIPKCAEIGIIDFLVTDISKDGLLQGPNAELYQSLQRKYGQYNFIASGGIASLDDVQHMDSLGMNATIVGKAIYEDKIDVNELVKLGYDDVKK